MGRPARAQLVALSRCCLGLVEGGLSGLGFVELRPGCARRIVFVCRCLSWLVLGLGCRPLFVRAGRVLAGAMRGLFCWFGVVFPPFSRRFRVAIVRGWVAVEFVLLA